MEKKRVGDYHYLIVGGTTKAATTSLFSYLANHPATCAATYKETRFFLSTDIRSLQNIDTKGMRKNTTLYFLTAMKSSYGSNQRQTICIATKHARESQHPCRTQS